MDNAITTINERRLVVCANTLIRNVIKVALHPREQYAIGHHENTSQLLLLKSVLDIRIRI